MSKKVAFDCGECEASGSIVHDLDDKVYTITACPFCGGDVDIDDPDFVADEIVDEENDD